MKRRATTILIPLFVVALASAATAPLMTLADAKKLATETITPEICRNRLTFIASDALMGRDTPSQGLDVAAEFIAFEMRRFGAKPGGDNGTFFQKFALARARFDKASSVTIGNVTITGADMEGNAVDATGTGDVVSYGENFDFNAAKGKIVLIPAGSPNSVEGRLATAGAAAALRDSTMTSEALKASAENNRRGGMQPEFRIGSGPAQMPRLRASAQAFGELAKASGAASFKVVRSMERVWTQNVVAVVEGSDPKLKAEYVAVGAHYDHVGARTTGEGDRIFNGADDDGSGTVALIGMVEAAMKGPKPKRSLIFVWHAGEEKGLWGSEYFNEKPTVPAGSIVAQLNIDMIGRSKAPGDTNARNKTLTGPNDIYVIGTTMMSTRLGEIIHQTNKDFLKIGYDPRYDAPNDPEQFFYRSDHYNYAKKGIPICFWFSGVHEDYHQAGDEVQKIDFNKLAKVTQTVFVTAIAVANEPTRPKVDKPLTR
ncbi:MAG: M28 family peptidase [Chthonomonas sp.]|nr:M28 family peptidase [Chthonomonas sp.]